MICDSKKKQNRPTFNGASVLVGQWKILGMDDGETCTTMQMYLVPVNSTVTAATAAKSLQSCLTLCDPIEGSPPGSLGFSMQEHWSGLPFSSPMHESETWKGTCSFVSDSSRPHGLQHTRLLRSWDLPAKSTGVGCHRLLWNSTVKYG